ncbi:MAG: nucleoside deaminase [Candidatus Tokpelaia sp.]|nr:MAG: nucleoside deaminase [Candidatus Tokpelaia sp.]KAA6207393.1 MAG: nucleoside deaminase [Candidatus Tokpelaia sp.]KAA6405096.1 nucleoside deaminase [Candidatus Tokpelaia sp.]
MREALNQARYAAQADEVPVGAVLVHENRIIAKAHNQTRGGRTYPPDPTAHAEICVLRLACAALGAERLDNCDLYVTLEPCTMCAAAISFARIRRLYYGAADARGGAVEHGPRFFSSPACFHAPELYPGLTERESETLLKEFFQKKRDK